MNNFKPRYVCFLFLIAVISYWTFSPFTSRRRVLDWDSLDAESSILRELDSSEKHHKWIVLTTVNHATDSIRKFVLQRDWKVVVVGDTATPKSWSSPGVVFLDVETQARLGFRIHKHLEMNAYSRKNIGYLYAIHHGAQYIYDTDDDNTIDENALNELIKLDKERRPYVLPKMEAKSAVFNAYPHFGLEGVWPRGFPLQELPRNVTNSYIVRTDDVISRITPEPLIHQIVVDRHPDVDAIYRLTQQHDLLLKFNRSAPPILLPKGVFGPFNAQSTLFTYRSFFTMMLPTSVIQRNTDIYRAYFSQALLGLIGGSLAYHPPTVNHFRNSHSIYDDFLQEIPMYSELGRLMTLVSEWKCRRDFVFDCASELIGELVGERLLKLKDRDVYDAWLADLSRVGYSPPIPRPMNSIDIEISPTFRYERSRYSSPCSLKRDVTVDTVFIVGVSGSGTPATKLERIRATFGDKYREVLFCLSEKPAHLVESVRHSYVIVNEVGGANCLTAALRIGYSRVSGYAFAPIDFAIGQRALTGRKTLVLRLGDFCRGDCDLKPTTFHSLDGLSPQLKLRVERCAKIALTG